MLLNNRRVTGKRDGESIVSEKRYGKHLADIAAADG